MFNKTCYLFNIKFQNFILYTASKIFLSLEGLNTIVNILVQYEELLTLGAPHIEHYCTQHVYLKIGIQELFPSDPDPSLVNKNKTLLKIVHYIAYHRLSY